MTTSGLKMFTRLPTPMASQLAHVPQRRQARGSPPAAAAATTAGTVERGPSGCPAASRIAFSPISVSQQPRAPQRHSRPAGLTTMWPSSPP